MEIIQQKLIWALGSLALLLIFGKITKLFKAEFNVGWSYTKWGITLLLVGGICGIFIKPFLPASVFGRVAGFILETIIGYTLGFSLIVLGTIKIVSRGNIPDHEKMPHNDKYSAIERTSIIEYGNISDAIRSMTPALEECFGKFGIVYHSYSKSGKLAIHYHQDIAPNFLNDVENPKAEGNLIYGAAIHGRPIYTSELQALPMEINSGSVKSAISLPVFYSNELKGVLTILIQNKITFEKCLIEKLQGFSGQLGSIAKRMEYELIQNDRNQMQSLMSLIIKSLKDEPDLYAAVVKISRAIIYSLPIQDVNLYLHGSGKIKIYEFAFPEGGVTRIISGYFPENKYPFLYEKATSVNGIYKYNHATSKGSSIIRMFYSIRGHKSLRGNLEFVCDPASNADFGFEWILTFLAENLGDYLKIQEATNSQGLINQYLGLISYFKERGLQNPRLDDFFEDLCNSLVRVFPMTSCNILIYDGKRRVLRSLASGHRRNDLESIKTFMPTGLTENLIRQINRNEVSIVNLGADKNTEIGHCLKSILSPDINQALVLPLNLDTRLAGVLIIGDARGQARGLFDNFTICALRDLAFTISVLISWRKDRNQSITASEGIRRLIIKSRGQSRAENDNFAPRLRSRINGPLAGILASCEYLRSAQGMISPEATQYIKNIEKSASRIHEYANENKSNNKMEFVKH